MSAPRGGRKGGEGEEDIEKRREHGVREGRKPASQPAREGPKNEKREKEGPIFVREKDDG